METKNDFVREEVFVLIKDQYGIRSPEDFEEYSKYKVVEILDFDDYVEARVAIEKVKFLEGPPVLVWIKKENFLSAFADLEQVAYSEETIPRHRLRTLLDLEELPNQIDNEMIVSLDLISNVAKINESLDFLGSQSYQYSNDEDLFADALINKLLNECPICMPFLKDEDEITKIFEWLLEMDDSNIHEALKNHYLRKNIVKRLNLFASNMKKKHIYSFVDSLREAIENEILNKLGEQILALYLLRNYHSSIISKVIDNLQDVLGPKIHLECQGQIFEALEGELLKAYSKTKLDSRINDILEIELNDIDELQVSNLNEYLNNCSGFFVVELREFILRFTKEICISYIKGSLDGDNARLLVHMSKRRFHILLEKYKEIDPTPEIEIQRAENILNLLDNIKSIASRDQITTFEDWVNLYEEKILKSDELVPKIGLPDEYGWCDRSYSKILENYEKLVEKKIHQFEEWLLREFPVFLDLIRSERAKNGLMLVTDVVQEIKESLEDSEKAVFLVVDSLELGLWFLLRKIFIEKGWEIEEERRVLSLIPSDTSISRRGLFGGDSLLNLEIAQRKAGGDLDDEPAALARALNIQRDSLSVVYHRGDFQRAINNINCSQLSCFVYREHDSLKHRTEETYDTYLTAVKHFFEKLVNEFDRIRLENYKIILATDHGSVETKRVKNACILNKRYATQGTGRYQIIGIKNIQGEKKSDQQISELKRELEENYKKSCIAIVGSELQKYGIPQNMKRVSDVIAIVIARGRDRFQWGKYPYTHGGLSFYETIIPFAILRKASDEKKSDPRIVRIAGEFTQGEKSKLEISLKNPNSTQDIEDLRITIKELGIFNWNFGLIPKSSMRSAAIMVMPEKAGKVQISIEEHYIIRNNEKCYIDSSTWFIDVKPSRRERINKMMKRAADRIFEEDSR